MGVLRVKDIKGLQEEKEGREWRLPWSHFPVRRFFLISYVKLLFFFLFYFLELSQASFDQFSIQHPLQCLLGLHPLAVPRTCWLS